jgi:hypothetical protein
MGIHKITMPYKNITASMTEMNGTSPARLFYGRTELRGKNSS